MCTCGMYTNIPRFISYKRFYHFISIFFKCDNDDDYDEDVFDYMSLISLR